MNIDKTRGSPAIDSGQCPDFENLPTGLGGSSNINRTAAH